MKKDLTEIVVILDESGSMSSICDDAIGGYNTFLEEQKKVPGEAKFTLVLFNNKYKLVYSGVDIQSVSVLDAMTYVPKNFTAMNDAIGKTLIEVGERLNNTPESERPEKVLVAILTDGQENASTEFSTSQIKEMIKHQQEKYSWEFMYLGANQDAFANANMLNISAVNTVSWTASSAGTRNLYGTLSDRTTTYRKK